MVAPAKERQGTRTDLANNIVQNSVQCCKTRKQLADRTTSLVRRPSIYPPGHWTIAAILRPDKENEMKQAVIEGPLLREWLRTTFMDDDGTKETGT